ncbi:MAG: RecX family transcriptional regulator [Treponema sp.]|nr:RecX family transcriptional regulator [Treponema sp.]
MFSFKAAYLSSEYDVEQICIPERELSQAELEALNFASACYRTEQAALRLTARAEQYNFGLIRKLESRGHSASCVLAVVGVLSFEDIINDSRYASLWIQSHLARQSGVSPRALAESLRRRGLSRSAVQGALSSVLDEETEAALLRSYLEKNRRRPVSRFRAAEEGSLRQLLRYEGFSPDLIDRFREECILL